MRAAVDEIQRFQPFEDALVLANDERIERQLQRIGLADDLAKIVLEDVGVLRREHDEPPVGELGAEGIVVPRLFLGVDARPSAGLPARAGRPRTAGVSPGLMSLGTSKMP